MRLLSYINQTICPVKWNSVQTKSQNIQKIPIVGRYFVHRHTHTHRHIQTYRHTHRHIQTHTHRDTHTHTHTHTHRHIHIQTHTHTHRHTIPFDLPHYIIIKTQTNLFHNEQSNHTVQH